MPALCCGCQEEADSDKYGAPIPSVDSALESWDSSGLDSNGQSKDGGNSKSLEQTGSKTSKGLV